MDEKKPPEDILDEILNRTPDASPLSYPPRYDPLEDIPLPPLKVPKKKSSPDWAAKLLPWLCVILGAALLVMGLCVLQVVGMGGRLDELQQAVESLQTMDSLQEENQRLQKDVEELRAQAEEMERTNSSLMEQQELTTQTLSVTTIQKWQGDYLFYIGQFMDNGDYPMAALVVGLSAERYFTASNLSNIPTNSAKIEQYRAYRQELIDRGYLEEHTAITTLNSQSPTELDFASQWNPGQDPDMAALGILWSALERCYVCSDPGTAAKYLVAYQQYPLGDPVRFYPRRIRDCAGEYAIRQYEQLICGLTEDGFLAGQEDALEYGPNQSGVDIIPYLPFLPTLYGDRN